MYPLDLQAILLSTVEHALDIQVHDLAECLMRMRVEVCTPCSAGVGEQNVNMVCLFLNLFHQALDLGDLGDVCWD